MLFLAMTNSVTLPADDFPFHLLAIYLKLSRSLVSVFLFN